jgi:hypothetical protein
VNRLVLVLLLAATGCDVGGGTSTLPSATPTPATPTPATPTPAAPAPSAAVIGLSAPAFACARTTGCATPAAPGSRVFAGGEARTDPGGAANLVTATTVFRLEE